MKKIVLSILLTFIVLSAVAQSASLAESYYKDANYEQALTEYAKLVHRYPTNALYNHRYARCAWENGDAQTALTYFIKSGDRYLLTQYYLGEIYFSLWHIDDAITHYKNYLNESTDPERSREVEQKINRAETIRRYLKHVEQVTLLNSVSLPLNRFLEAYLPYQSSGTIAIDSLGHSCFLSPMGDRRLIVNGDSIWQISNQYHLLDSWGEIETLPATVNFTPMVNYPFLMSDGVTLYFAAQDSTGLGGWDIYVSRYNSATEQYTVPENIGFPFNSPKNDYLYFVDEGTHTGLWASDRFSGADSVTVYSFRIAEEKQYIRNVTEDSLVAYARLQIFNREERDTLPIVADSVADMPEQEEEKGAFRLVLNDSTVYTRTEDFLNDTAAQKYAIYLEREAELQTLTHRLDALRRQYAGADEQQQKELTPSILQQENRQGQLVHELSELLHQVLQLEQSEY